ncbi:MAG TPA: hypothetical protein VJA94_21325, partial [Candidatus Angelobacter sp.]
MPASKPARLFIALIALSGLAVLGNALMHAGSDNRVRFVSFLLVACIAARLKVKLPGVTGTMSVNLPFILVAVAEMNTAEAMVVSCMSTLVQCVPTAGKKFNWVQTLFNFCNMALAVGATRLLYDSALLESIIKSRPLLLALVTVGYFAVNSVPVAIIIWLTEGKNPVRAWVTMFQLSYPYFLIGASVAGLVIAVSSRVAWQLPVLVLPLMLGVFYSYRRYFAAL